MTLCLFLAMDGTLVVFKKIVLGFKMDEKKTFFSPLPAKRINFFDSPDESKNRHRPALLLPKKESNTHIFTQLTDSNNVLLILRVLYSSLYCIIRESLLCDSHNSFFFCLTDSWLNTFVLESKTLFEVQTEAKVGTSFRSCK